MFVFECLLMLHIKMKALCSFSSLGFYWLFYFYYDNHWTSVIDYMFHVFSTIAQGMHVAMQE